MTHKKRTLENKIESSKVFRLRPLKDDKGKYIPYCNFGFHMGIVLSYDICEERKCTHYKRLYL